MANLTVRVDDDLKRQAEEVLADSGLTMTTAINAFLTEVVRSNGIPFALQADPFFQCGKSAPPENCQRADGTKRRNRAQPRLRLPISRDDLARAARETKKNA